jgi:tetratricopeptide (TPR) repeat protein
MKHLLLLPALPALLVAVPAGASIREESALPAYVKGRVASGEDRLSEARRAFAVARSADGQAAEVKLRSFETALMTGDMKAALSFADQLARVDLPERAPSRYGFNDAMIALVRAAGAAGVRDWRAFDQARAAFAEPNPDAVPVVSTILEAWSFAARGDFSRALLRLDPAERNPLARSYFLEHRAHVLALARRWPEAAEAYAALVAGDGSNVPRLRLQAAGAALEAGRVPGEDRQAWRSRAIAALGGGPQRDPLLMDARARLAADPKADGRALGGIISGPAEGLAYLFLRLSVDSARERPQPASAAFGRLATWLAPGLPETWLVTGDMLARLGLHELALEALARTEGTALARAGRIRAAQAQADAGRTEAARAMVLAQAEAADGTAEDWVRLSDIERSAGDDAAAARTLDRAVAALGEPVEARDAYVFFLRGSARERSGDWAGAEADLRRAVELQPGNAVFLNYLGYSLLDRAEKLDEADALIARAYKASPENGAIIDSMGWAKYVRGAYPEAVALLERARAAEPSDPTVADHLGDALWRVGRRIEARHAWESALTLEPDAKVKSAIERKLAYGLDIALARR